MIGHPSKGGGKRSDYIRYYKCCNSHYKGSVVCRTNLVRADDAENYVFSRLAEVTNSPSVLNDLIERVNAKVKTLKDPLEARLRQTLDNIKIVQAKAKKLLSTLENSTSENNGFILNRLNELQNELQSELKTLESYKVQLEHELIQPLVKEVSTEQIQGLLSNFSTLLVKAEPEKQKDILHAIVNEITVNSGSNPTERSIKEIVLFFDASLKNNAFVLIYGTVLRDECNGGLFNINVLLCNLVIYQTEIQIFSSLTCIFIINKTPFHAICINPSTAVISIDLF